MSTHEWKWMRAGRMRQVKLTCGDDIARLAELDRPDVSFEIASQFEPLETVWLE